MLRRLTAVALLSWAVAASAVAAEEAISLPPIEIHTSYPLVPPAYQHTPRPRYPVAAREQGIEGTVVLSVLVGGDGRVEDVRVASSSGSRLLDESALTAVRRWTFVPARRGPRPVETVVEVPVKFTLSGR